MYLWHVLKQKLNRPLLRPLELLFDMNPSGSIKEDNKCGSMKFVVD